MTASGKKRKRGHTSDEFGKAGKPVPSRQKEPAAANIGDDGPPRPIDTTTTGDCVMGSAPKQKTRYGRTVKSPQRILAAMCTEISEATRAM
jgi:hypothetical protein